LTPQAERFDAIIVGARCAGSPLAALLARSGLRIAVLDEVTFPRDTLSTHILQAPALAFLDQLGLTEQIRATGAPPMVHVNVRQENLEFTAEVPQQTDDVGGIISVRRFLLDSILSQAAVQAGAEIRTATKVTAMLRDGARVTGVRIAHDGDETVLNARLVVGADGRNSTVAKLVGARKYNVTPNRRFAYWSYFEGAGLNGAPTFVFHRWGDRLVMGCPADSGLYQVIVMPGLADLPRFRTDLAHSFMDYALSCRPVADALSGASRSTQLFGMRRWEGFFRETSGPGWVLIGDAGHFKDPSLGHGIQDAFRQAGALAPVIINEMANSDRRFDRALSDWWRWRDHDADEFYWLAADMGKDGCVPAVQPEITNGLLRRGKIDLFVNLLTHRSIPSKVFTPARLVTATGRLLLRPGCNRRAVLGDVRGLLAEHVRRRRLMRRPSYVSTNMVTEHQH
jgi:2-polyprenyl-6-methoxyphenol hydroxylase-like FAD-dependent oxidoreductase